ncbi:hypothetical protein Nepgr_031300 [Nepenthes gracilis]|uniref:Uncharacterized protein n=1 Tax=Nepenthes gracilis TaxID=150966 RepID=A0AAD3Y4P0_NEPGR|nr:hypothetical protein Nepgr_031300 [Nepenthes gracilis]
MVMLLLALSRFLLGVEWAVQWSCWSFPGVTSVISGFCLVAVNCCICCLCAFTKQLICSLFGPQCDLLLLLIDSNQGNANQMHFLLHSSAAAITVVGLFVSGRSCSACPITIADNAVYLTLCSTSMLWFSLPKLVSLKVSARLMWLVPNLAFNMWVHARSGGGLLVGLQSRALSG